MPDSIPSVSDVLCVPDSLIFGVHILNSLPVQIS